MVKDYLNFYCQSCKKNLCKEHYHIDINCPFTEKVEDKQGLKLDIQYYKCSFCNVETPNHSGATCKYCNKDFCLAHRLESDHKCEKGTKVGGRTNYENSKNKFKDKLAQLKKGGNK